MREEITTLAKDGTPMDVPTNVPLVQPPAGAGTPAHVQDRLAYVRECVRRTLLRTALGETYRYDVFGVLAQTGPGTVEAGYVLYVSTPSPVPIGSYCSVASVPFEFDADDEMIEKIALAVVAKLRSAVGEALRVPETH